MVSCVSSPLRSRGTGSRRQYVNKRVRLCSSTTLCGRSAAAWRWLSGCRLPLPAPWDYLQKLKTVWPLDFLSLRESKTQSLVRSRIRPVNAAPVTTELSQSPSCSCLVQPTGSLSQLLPGRPFSMSAARVRHCLGSLAAQSHMLTCYGWVQASRHGAGGGGCAQKEVVRWQRAAHCLSSKSLTHSDSFAQRCTIKGWTI